VFFYFTTCGWMMWNWLVSGLASGATLMLYDGSPFAEGRSLLLWIDAAKASRLRYQRQVHRRPRERRQAAGAQPRPGLALRTILSTGSPLVPRASSTCIATSRPTSACRSPFPAARTSCPASSAAAPCCRCYRGEIQAAGSGHGGGGLDDAGAPVRGEKGELVCTRPFPSMPDRLLERPGRRALSRRLLRPLWPGVWAHGDFAELTAHDGFVIHGRSDAVLNPGGVRIGTAEIYRQVEQIPEVLESIVAIGQDWADDVRVVLFVVLREGCELDEDLCARIRRMIRDNTTPRHVPAKIVQVADIPRTISGKIVELATCTARR
jgi:acetoacetyl-CoA synthetase